MSVKWKIDSIKSYADDIAQDIERLEKKIAATPLGDVKIETLLTYPDVSKITSMSAMSEAFAKAQGIQEENAKKISNNKSVYEKAKGVMNGLGLKDTERQKKSGSRYPYKYIDVTCPWLHSIGCAIPMNDGWSNFKGNYDSRVRIIQDTEKKALAEQAKIEQEKQFVEREESRRVFTVSMIKKYDLDPTFTFDDVFDEICGKNKYLYLGYCLEQNRIDWNDGYTIASRGLDFFANSLEDGVDKDIYDDIASYINDWDGDGRVFRDCTWNYNRLYTIAETEDGGLYEDFSKARELVD